MSNEETTPETTPEQPAVVAPMPDGMTVKSRHTGTVTRVDLGGALISLGEARIDGAVDLRHDRALLERLMPLPGALLMVPGSWFDPPRR